MGLDRAVSDRHIESASFPRRARRDLVRWLGNHPTAERIRGPTRAHKAHARSDLPRHVEDPPALHTHRLPAVLHEPERHRAVDGRGGRGCWIEIAAAIEAIEKHGLAEGVG